MKKYLDPIIWGTKKIWAPLFISERKSPRPIIFFRKKSLCPIFFFRRKSHCPIKFFQVKSTCPIIRSLNITISSIQKSQCPIIPTGQKTICPINIPTNHQKCSKLLVEVYWGWFSSEMASASFCSALEGTVGCSHSLSIILSRALELQMFSS